MYISEDVKQHSLAQTTEQKPGISECPPCWISWEAWPFLSRVCSRLFLRKSKNINEVFWSYHCQRMHVYRLLLTQNQFRPFAIHYLTYIFGFSSWQEWFTHFVEIFSQNVVVPKNIHPPPPQRRALLRHVTFFLELNHYTLTIWYQIHQCCFAYTAESLVP